MNEMSTKLKESVTKLFLSGGACRAGRPIFLQVVLAAQLRLVMLRGRFLLRLVLCRLPGCGRQ